MIIFSIGNDMLRVVSVYGITLFRVQLVQVITWFRVQFGINKDEISFQRLNSCDFTYFVESNVALRYDHQTLLKKIKDI